MLVDGGWALQSIIHQPHKKSGTLSRAAFGWRATED
jgi:hypothetical protein